ncbi:MAG: hypothetical protein ABW252_18285 [Polyangiales bacterium]
MHSKITTTILSALALAGALSFGHGSAAALDNENCDRESGNICFEAIDGHEFWFNPGVGFTTKKGVLSAQADGNLVLKDETGRVRWSSNTSRQPGAAAVWQEDGNLVVYQRDRPIWASNTGGIGAYLVLQTDGNLVIYDANDKPIWATNTGH